MFLDLFLLIRMILLCLFRCGWY